MQSRSWIQCLLGTVLVLGSMGLQAAPIVYMLQTVGDGENTGEFSFIEAEITIVFESDTSTSKPVRGRAPAEWGSFSSTRRASLA